MGKEITEWSEDISVPATGSSTGRERPNELSLVEESTSAAAWLGQPSIPAHFQSIEEWIALHFDVQCASSDSCRVLGSVSPGMVHGGYVGTGAYFPVAPAGVDQAAGQGFLEAQESGIQCRVRGKEIGGL